MEVQLKGFLGVSAMQENKCVFERIVNVSDSVRFPFDSLVSNMKLLYGTSAIVTFNVSTGNLRQEYITESGKCRPDFLQPLNFDV